MRDLGPFMFPVALTLSCSVLTAPALSAEPESEKSDARDKYEEAREVMVRTQIKARDVKDEEVLAAMRKVKRHQFVLPQYVNRAYADYPLPIGEGQTISQPYIVALMTDLLEIGKDEEKKKVLEIGTGSGYQAAVLAEIVDDVYTVEIIPALAERARKTLDAEGYDDVKTLSADGYYGWKEHAPFDAIIVTCAPDHVPQPLVKQLKDGGVMVIPVGRPGLTQTLWQIRKKGGKLDMKNIIPVRFVPFRRKTATGE